MEFTDIRDRASFEDYLESNSQHRRRAEFEQEQVVAWKDLEEARFEADCFSCQQRQPLLVDRLGATDLGQGLWLPNWRERLLCPQCNLNNRQRAMAQAVSEALAIRGTGERKVYATEQVTQFHDWLERESLTDLVGSEYLGDDLSAGQLVDRLGKQLRHENVEQLSFPDRSFDLLISNDVLEHVNEPRLAIEEMARVLKAGGQLFLSVPFYTDREGCQRRARLREGELEHLQPPEYHGNPVSEDGSLVFYDFGWELLEWLRSAGYRDVKMRIYWSEKAGYLGNPQYFFHAVKKRFRRLWF